MATLNRTFTNYVPNDNPLYVIPVQQGSVRNLTIGATPAGQGILGWVDGTANELRCAVVPVLADCFTDDVVPPGDVRTIWYDDGSASPNTQDIWTGVIWVYGPDLYVFVSHHQGNNGKIECYIADDIENPVVWTLHGTVRNFTDTGGFSNPSVRMGGGPTVDVSGRWLLPYHNYIEFAAARLEDAIGLHTSDDSGVTWVTRISARKGALFGGSAGPQSTTTVFEPDSSLYWFGARIGSVTQWRPYSSVDTGTTWAVNEQGSGNFSPFYYIDDGTVLYAGLISSQAMRLYRIDPGDDPMDPSTWTDLSMRGIISDTISTADGYQIIPLVVNGGLYGVAFTAKDRIAFRPLCVPVHPRLLHIPFKDRLEVLGRDFTDFAIVEAQDHQFDNFKVIERWAADWMTLAGSPDRCELFIPFKDHSRHPSMISAAQSFDNWKAIERWAYSVLSGDCGCGCVGVTPPPDRCRLFVPHKDHLLGVDPLDPHAMAIAAEHEFDNYKTFERWANRYAWGECGCTMP